MYELFRGQKDKNNNPNLLFLIVTGTSTDKAMLSAAGDKYRELGKWYCDVKHSRG